MGQVCSALCSSAGEDSSSYDSQRFPKYEEKGAKKAILKQSPVLLRHSFLETQSNSEMCIKNPERNIATCTIDDFDWLKVRMVDEVSGPWGFWPSSFGEKNRLKSTICNQNSKEEITK